MRFPQILLMFFLFILSGCFFKSQETGSKEKTTKTRQRPYFISVPINKLSATQIPCIDAEIDGKPMSMELDLGYRGNITLLKEYTDLIENKTFVCEKFMYGFRGKQYPTDLYKISKIQIGKMTFLDPILQIGTTEFLRDATFTQNGRKPSPRDPGRLGWEMFRNVNLLIDINDRLIAFCDSLDTLKMRGYRVDSFIRVPLLVDRGLVEFIADTPQGALRCTLDTGSTINLLSREKERDQSLDEAILDPANILEYSCFKINGEDFGPIAFQSISTSQLPIRIEAILGMEFFKKNIVFVDFRNSQIYFSKNSSLFSVFLSIKSV